jgi:hypothetical protein
MVVDPEFLNMVRAKIDGPGNDLIGLSGVRKQELNQ